MRMRVCGGYKAGSPLCFSAELAKSLGSNVLAVGKVDITSEVLGHPYHRSKETCHLYTTTLLGRCSVSNRKDRGSLW